MISYKVTIVMPVYNAQRYLRESLDAIISQTYRNLEIICVDDGSTDDSPDILREYSSKDTRVKVIKQKNQYAGIARNNGLLHATGDYIMFIDSDDVLEKGAVKYLIQKADKYKTDIIVYGYYMFTENVRQRRPTRNKYKIGMLCSSEDIRDNVFQITRSMPWDKFIRTAFLRRTGLQYQGMRVSEDIFVNRTMMTEAKKIYFSGKRLINYRIGNQESLQGKINNYPAEFLKGNLAIYDELKRIGTYETYKKSFEEMIVADAIIHLKSIGSYEHFLAIIESANLCSYWSRLCIDKNSDAVEHSEYKNTINWMIDGNVNECLANLYIDTKRSSVERSSAEYKIGHRFLKALHLTY